MQIASPFDAVPALQTERISSPAEAEVSYLLFLNVMINPLRRKLLDWTVFEGKHQEGPGESTLFPKFSELWAGFSEPFSELQQVGQAGCAHPWGGS